MTAIVIAPAGIQHTVRFAYDPAVVALIKQVVPGYARVWSAQARAWYVDRDWTAVLAAELRRRGHTVTEPADPAQQHAGDWARLLFKRVGRSRSEQVFRALSKCFHPDLAGGDAQLQRELTTARNELATK